uniref:Smad6/7-2 n=1 Tax=Hofstenia miamia TaxID=442651 RepID=A0A068CRN2_HOFMI|nr:smad6/7-2 [Hofstenia miamia]
MFGMKRLILLRKLNHLRTIDNTEHEHRSCEFETTIKRFPTEALRVLVRCARISDSLIATATSSCIEPVPSFTSDLDMFHCAQQLFTALRSQDEHCSIKRLASCTKHGCCNPWHWFLVTKESEEMTRDIVSPLRVKQSIAVFAKAINGKLPECWSYVAHWEKSVRMGPLHPVRSPVINLSLYANQKYPKLHSSQLITMSPQFPDEDIDYQCVFSMDSSGSIWIYNLSNVSLFYAAPTINHKQVKRLDTGQCAAVFIASIFQEWCRDHCLSQVVDWRSITLSWGKGWGPGYIRQNISQCSHWSELILNFPCN